MCKIFLQDSDSLRERMVTIENQLKKLQQCLNSTGSSNSAGNSNSTLASTLRISSSTGNSASENEVICIREAETSEREDTLAPPANSENSNVITDKTMQLMQKTDQDHCTTDTDNNSTTDDNT